MPRRGPLRLAGALMVLTAVQPAAMGLTQADGAPASLLALGAVWLLLGILTLLGSRAALLPALAVAVLLVGAAFWRIDVLLPAAGVTAYWGALVLPLAAGLAALNALLRR